MIRSRIFIAVLAVYTAVLASGAPLPIAGVTAWLSPPRAGGEDAERFPCEACPCGCSTAAHCWTKCCCHSLGERLAWARREGVRPPAKVLDEAAVAGLDIRDWRPGTGSKRYVLKPASPKSKSTTVPACCAAKPACCVATKPACCAKRAADTESHPEPEPKRPTRPGVSLVQALACQGIVESWLALGEAPLPAPTVVVMSEATSPACGFYQPLEDRSADAPTPPPPERRRFLVG